MLHKSPGGSLMGDMNKEPLPDDLIGPRSDEREERVISDVTEDGKPMWMAYLTDPDALVDDPSDVHQAKNAYAEALQKDPETISMCARVPMDECVKIIQSKRLNEAA